MKIAPPRNQELVASLPDHIPIKQLNKDIEIEKLGEKF